MFTLPDLPYSYSALEPFIDEETMYLHHDKHHAAYVNNLNDALKEQPEFLEMSIEGLLQKLDLVPEDVRTKVRNNGGGHWNHTFFWGIMGPKSDAKPGKGLMSAITSSFGGLEQMQEKVNAAGLTRFGSGWVWVIKDNDSLKITDTPNQDSPIMEGKTPILGIDVWEHAYYLKYKNVRADYLKAWWNVVNWERVEMNFQA
jgi:Fe-Mn family superoxide dismutase